MKTTLLAFLVLSSVLAYAQQGAAPAPDARLRESLKATMLQLRTAEAEKATLQANQATLEQKNKELASQVEKLIKQAQDDKAEHDKKVEGLNGKTADLEKTLAQYKEALEKWKAAHAEIVGVAKAKEAERAKLAAKTVVMQRRIDEQQAKNMAMFKAANEVLDRYEKFGLGTALTAREPFTGITRVRLKGLMQDFRDELEDQQVHPEGPGANSSGKTAPPPNNTTAKTGS